MIGFFILASCLTLVLGSNPYEEFRSNLEYLPDTNLAEPAYRLLDTVVPTDVYVHLDTYLDESRFNGFVRLIVDVSNKTLFFVNIIFYFSFRTIFSSAIIIKYVGYGWSYDFELI